MRRPFVSYSLLLISNVSRVSLVECQSKISEYSQIPVKERCIDGTMLSTFPRTGVRVFKVIYYNFANITFKEGAFFQLDT